MIRERFNRAARIGCRKPYHGGSGSSAGFQTLYGIFEDKTVFRIASQSFGRKKISLRIRLRKRYLGRIYDDLEMIAE